MSWIISDFQRVDQWFDKDAMQRNPSRYKAIVFGATLADLKFVSENIVLP